MGGLIIFSRRAQTPPSRGESGAQAPRNQRTRQPNPQPQRQGGRGGKTPVILNGGEDKGDNQDPIYNCKKGKPKRIHICNTAAGERPRTRPAAEADAQQPKRATTRRSPPTTPQRGEGGGNGGGAATPKRARQGAAARQGAGAGAGDRRRQRTRQPNPQRTA